MGEREPAYIPTQAQQEAYQLRIEQGARQSLL